MCVVWQLTPRDARQHNWTQQKCKGIQHNSPEAVIFKENWLPLVCYLNPRHILGNACHLHWGQRGVWGSSSSAPLLWTWSDRCTDTSWSPVHVQLIYCLYAGLWEQTVDELTHAHIVPHYTFGPSAMCYMQYVMWGGRKLKNEATTGS